jgi:hypothetical protein
MTDIKITAVKPNIKYIANGSLKIFEFPFAVFNENDIKVYVDDTLKTTGYNITVNSDGTGEVEFLVAPINEAKITIIRDLEIKRITDFKAYSSLKADQINYELDYQTACIQEIEDQLSRSLKLPLTSDIENLTLPDPKAGYALLWNETEDGIENSDINIQEEVDLAVNSSNIAAQALADIENLLGTEDGAGFIGLANNMLVILKEKYPEAFWDYGYITETATHDADYGDIAVAEIEDEDYGVIAY